MEETPKKKMSKGCMVGLIIAGVIVLLLIAVVIIGYSYRENIAKFGVVTIVNQVKTQLATQPVDGVDTVQYNAVADGFLERFADDTVRAEGIQELMPALQAASSSDHTPEDISRIIEAMIQYYPDLADVYQSMELSADSSSVPSGDSAVSSE